MGKRLNQFVEVAGTWYGPEDDVPEDVAEKIQNPKVWADDNPSGTGGNGDNKAVKAGTPSGARLAMYVDVGGDTYGPDDPVPDDVAAKITNAAAWVDGKLPPAAEQTARKFAGERTAATPPPLPNSGTPAARAGDLSFAGTTLPPDVLRQAQERSDAAGAEGDGGDGGDPPAPASPAPTKKAIPKKAPGSGSGA